MGGGLAYFCAFFMLFIMYVHYYFCSDGKVGTTRSDNGRKVGLLSPRRRVREERESVWLHEPSIAAFNEVMRHIVRIQFPFSCENSCYYSLSYNHPHGFGSRVHMMTAALSIALERGCILVAESKNAAEWTHNHALKPITNCTLPTSRKIKKIGKDILQRVLMRHTPKIQDLNVSITVWLTAATSFLLRPTHKFDSIIKQAISESIPHKECYNSVVGIHVRHSDKGSEAKILPFSLYLEEIANWENITSTQVKCIFVATDDLALKKDIEGKNSTCLHQSDESSEYRFITLNESRVNKLSNLEQILLELHVLAWTKTLAFTFSSNFGRLAMFLNPRNLEHSFSLHEMPKLIPLDFYQGVKFGPRSTSYGYFFVWIKANIFHQQDRNLWIVIPVPINEVRKKLSCNPARVGCSYDSKINHLRYLTDEYFCKSEDCLCCNLFPRLSGIWPHAVGPNISEIFPRSWKRYAHAENAIF